LILAGLTALVGLLAVWNLATALDAQIHDRLTRLGAQPVDTSGVLIVDIDESSLAQVGPWPWPRPVIAELMKRLRDQGAVIQVWDTHFPEPAPGDDVLNAVLSAPIRAGRNADIVLGQVLVLDPKVHSPPMQGTLRLSPGAPDVCSESSSGVHGYLGVTEALPDAPAVGHLTATPDPDGGLRRLPAVVCRGSDRFPQLALAAVQRLAPGDEWVIQPGNSLTGPDRWLVRGTWRFALDRQGNLKIPYRRDHERWQAVTALQVLEGRTDTVALKGRIVLVGATALGLADTVSTPFHANAPGVSVHAELLAAAAGGRWVVVPPYPSLVAAVVFLIGTVLMWAATPWMRRPAMLLPLGLPAALTPLAMACVGRLMDVELPVFAPTVGLVCTALTLAMLQVDSERRRASLLATHLESVLPRELAREIARQHPNGQSLGRPGHGVVLAVKVVGLERWSAAVDSLKALALIHGISTLVEGHVVRSGGRLEQVQGETLLAIWRFEQSARVDSVPSEHDHRTAVETALRTARLLLVDLQELLARSESERYPLGLRMAVEVGPFLLAVAGSTNARRPLLLGPSVDGALGLLPLCEELASPLLLGQAAAQTLPRVTLSPMGSFLLPDGAGPQVVHRVDP
jgi:adenylate cyclase